MSIILTRDSKLPSLHLRQIVKLIQAGGEINATRTQLMESLLRSDLIAYDYIDNTVICTATLNNPQTIYRERVFGFAKVRGSKNYDKELGYISVHRNYERQGHCQRLLQDFFPHIANQKIYATTRNPAMAHILRKFGFIEKGQEFNRGLKLMLYDGGQ